MFQIMFRFQNAILFQGDLSGWRTPKLHHVANMFDTAINYQGGQALALWNTSQFQDMSAMFQHAVKFQVRFNVRSVVNSEC
jgi:Mycoplasma protein of unknown function, DUF285